MAGLDIQQSEEGVVLKVKVVPGSSRTMTAGVLDGMLKIKIASAPEKGKANQELIRYISGKLNIKKKTIVIISGQTSPIKQLRFASLSIDELSQKLDGLVNISNHEG
jgi:uncharacterized protein (TIGR00251 family)